MIGAKFLSHRSIGGCPPWDVDNMLAQRHDICGAWHANSGRRIFDLVISAGCYCTVDASKNEQPILVTIHGGLCSQYHGALHKHCGGCVMMISPMADKNYVDIHSKSYVYDTYRSDSL